MADINAIIAQGFDPGKVIQPFIDAPKNALAMKMAQSQLAGNESENALRKAQIGKIDKEQEQQAQLQTYAKMAQISQKHAADVQRDPANLKLHNASAKMMAERMGVGQYWKDAATKEQALQDDAALQQQFAALFAATNGDAYGSPIQTVDNGKTVATSISKVPGIPDRTTDIKGNPPSVESAGMRIEVSNDKAGQFMAPVQFMGSDGQPYFREMNKDGSVTRVTDAFGRQITPEQAQNIGGLVPLNTSNIRERGEISFNNADEKELQKGYTTLTKIQPAIDQGQKDIAEMNKLIGNGLKTGKLEDMYAGMSRYFNTDTATAKQQFDKLSANLLQQRIQALQGTGPVQVAKMRALQAALPQFDGTPEATTYILGQLDDFYKTQKREFNAMTKYKHEHGGKLADFYYENNTDGTPKKADDTGGKDSAQPEDPNAALKEMLKKAIAQKMGAK